MPNATSGRYAIIEESGGQRKVHAGDEFIIDLHQHGDAAAGTTITFDRVLVLSEPSGDAAAKIGQPYVAGASVTVEITDPMLKGDKIYIYKFKPKTGFRRKTGHRQRFTAVRVTAING